MLKKYIQSLELNRHLDTNTSKQCLLDILSGECSTEEIKQVLTLLAGKGETFEEILGFAQAMREKALKIKLPKPVLDNCGTGGTNKNRFNVSTASTFILAAGGVAIAKHGNRGSKQTNGSFDFLESLEINFDLTPEQIIDRFNKTDLAFLFARNHHLAMKYVAPARKELGRRTIFNLIGPLSNPACPEYQIIGTNNQATAKKIAQAIQQLGITKALIIVGANGIDELSTVSDSIIYEVTPQKIKETIFSPQDLNLKAQQTDIEGGLATQNAKLFKELFENKIINHPISELICLNAGAGFYCAGKTDSIKTGFELAQQLLQNGQAWQKYQELLS